MYRIRIINLIRVFGSMVWHWLKFMFSHYKVWTWSWKYFWIFSVCGCSYTERSIKLLYSCWYSEEEKKNKTWTTAGAPSRGWPVTDRDGGASFLPYTSAGVTGSGDESEKNPFNWTKTQVPKSNHPSTRPQFILETVTHPSTHPFRSRQKPT